VSVFEPPVSTRDLRLSGLVTDLDALLSEVQELRHENAKLREYERMYFELLDESVKRGQTDTLNWIALLMSGRIRAESP
jgi:hypothetical protein